MNYLKRRDWIGICVCVCRWAVVDVCVFFLFCFDIHTCLPHKSDGMALAMIVHNTLPNWVFGQMNRSMKSVRVNTPPNQTKPISNIWIVWRWTDSIVLVIRIIFERSILQSTSWLLTDFCFCSLSQLNKLLERIKVIE